MSEKDKKQLKKNKKSYLIGGIVCLFLSIVLIPIPLLRIIVFIIGCVLLYLSHSCKKAYKKIFKELEQPVEQTVIKPPVTEVIKIEQTSVVEKKEPISEQEYNRLKEMCINIHKEYKQLLKDYKDSDADRKVYILKECYRKLTVIESTVNKHECYYDIDTYEEYEKIEKKARSFINAYIKEERESGSDDYMIDVLQFSSDLDFISDYIYEKDEKLNKM